MSWKPDLPGEELFSPFATSEARNEITVAPHVSVHALELPWAAPAEASGETESWFRNYPTDESEDPATGSGGSAAPTPPVVVTNDPTIGFEFDLSVGLNRDVFSKRAADMPLGSTFPTENVELTDHVGRDSADKVVDGFKVTRDGSRLEIATVPIKVNDDASFNAVVANVLKFAKELEAARKKVRPDRSIKVTDIAGHPVRFTHTRTLISKLPIVIAVRGSKKKKTLKWPTDSGVWASPQATITIGLDRVGDLVDAIAASAGKSRGTALTGSSSQRLGVRSDIAVIAKKRVLADRARKIGATLSDKSTVSNADFSDRLTGLLILMTQYMLCGEILDPKKRDHELFAKSYLPINVKAPFWVLYKEALTDRERLVFKDLYFTASANFYGLAKDGATATDGDTELFPPQVRGPDLDRFHSTRLTWKTLLTNTVNGTPLKVSKANTIPKKNHALGDEVLFAPISSIISYDKTKPGVALELRRIGFDAHPVRVFEQLMKTVRALSKKLT